MEESRFGWGSNGLRIKSVAAGIHVRIKCYVMSGYFVSDPNQGSGGRQWITNEGQVQ